MQWLVEARPDLRARLRRSTRAAASGIPLARRRRGRHRRRRREGLPAGARHRARRGRARVDAAPRRQRGPAAGDADRPDRRVPAASARCCRSSARCSRRSAPTPTATSTPRSRTSPRARRELAEDLPSMLGDDAGADAAAGLRRAQRDAGAGDGRRRRAAAARPDARGPRARAARRARRRPALRARLPRAAPGRDGHRHRLTALRRVRVVPRRARPGGDAAAGDQHRASSTPTSCAAAGARTASASGRSGTPRSRCCTTGVHNRDERIHVDDVGYAARFLLHAARTVVG